MGYGRQERVTRRKQEEEKEKRRTNEVRQKGEKQEGEEVRQADIQALEGRDDDKTGCE